MIIVDRWIFVSSPLWLFREELTTVRLCSYFRYLFKLLIAWHTTFLPRHHFISISLKLCRQRRRTREEGEDENRNGGRRRKSLEISPHGLNSPWNFSLTPFGRYIGIIRQNDAAGKLKHMQIVAGPICSRHLQFYEMQIIFSYSPH